MAMQLPTCSGCLQEITTTIIKPCDHAYHPGCLKNLVSARNQLRQNEQEQIKCSGNPNCAISNSVVNEILTQAIEFFRSDSPEPVEACCICKESFLESEEHVFERQAVVICASYAKEAIGCDLEKKENISGHQAHRECAIKWALTNGTCPVDRTLIIFKNLIPPMTKQQYLKFYGAELSDAMFLGIYSCILIKIAKAIFTHSDNVTGWYYSLCLATFIQPVINKLHWQLIGDVEYKIVRRFPDIFWRKWAVRVAGLSLGVGGTALIGRVTRAAL